MTVIWQNSQLAVSTCKVATGHNTERHGVNTVSKNSLGSSPVNGQHNSTVSAQHRKVVILLCPSSF